MWNSFVQSTRILRDLKWNWIFSTYLRQRNPNITFHQNPFSGSPVVAWGRRTDGHDEANGRSSQFRESAGKDVLIQVGQTSANFCRQTPLLCERNDDLFHPKTKQNKKKTKGKVREGIKATASPSATFLVYVALTASYKRWKGSCVYGGNVRHRKGWRRPPARKFFNCHATAFTDADLE